MVDVLGITTLASAAVALMSGLVAVVLYYRWRPLDDRPRIMRRGL